MLDKIKLKIIEINDYKFTLQDKRKDTYSFELTFLGLEKPLCVGDYLFFSSELLNKTYEEYSTNYIFGPLDEPYGREISDKHSIDLIKIKTKNNTIFLKRFFG